jgi:hypothetical protein
MNTNYFNFFLRALRELRGNRNFCLTIYAAKSKRPFEKSNGLSFSFGITVSCIYVEAISKMHLALNNPPNIMAD